MCLAIPVKIEKIDGDIAHCRVGESDTFLDVSLMILDEEAQLGDFLIVHAGFALRKLDPKEAEETLNILRQMAQHEFGEVGF